MDHFNATVKDGKLIKTRRGLQVSRQRFNGLSFVNAYPRDDDSSASVNSILPGPTPPRAPSSSAHVPTPQRREIRFVDECAVDSGVGKTPTTTPEDDDFQTNSRAATTSSGSVESFNNHKIPSTITIITFSNRLGNTTTSFSPSSSIGIGITISNKKRSTNISRLRCSQQVIIIIAQLPRPRPPLPPRRRRSALFLPARRPAGVQPGSRRNVVERMEGGKERRGCHGGGGSGWEENEKKEQEEDDEDEDDRLAHYVSNTCAILSQKLDRDGTADVVVTLHCIATLAWVGCYTNRLDHWKLHMSGLKKVLDLNAGSGLDSLPAWLVDELHRTDLLGATLLVTTPYLLPFHPNSSRGPHQHTSPSPSLNPSTITPSQSITSILPSSIRERYAKSVLAVLQPLGVHAEVISALSSLATFSAAVRLARRSKREEGNKLGVGFDPHVFVNELYSLSYALLTRPEGTLRGRGAEEGGGFSRALVDDNYDPDDGDDDMTNHETTTATATTTAAAQAREAERTTKLATLLTSTLRIAALLYLSHFLPPFPRPPGESYAPLLCLLRRRLGELLDLVMEDDRHKQNEELRCVAMFLAVVGVSVSRGAGLGMIGTEEEEQGTEYHHHSGNGDGGVYGQVLRQIVGVSVAGEKDEEEKTRNEDNDGSTISERTTAHGHDDRSLLINPAEEQNDTITPTTLATLFDLPSLFGPLWTSSMQDDHNDNDNDDEVSAKPCNSKKNKNKSTEESQQNDTKDLFNIGTPNAPGRGHPSGLESAILYHPTQHLASFFPTIFCLSRLNRHVRDANIKCPPTISQPLQA
ncbi:hypothetical protein VTJ04DRAFT_3827 [Mycothermus thermophilus]|uniref:uncharacterized protein n=1 Tax=Humicola insolens TaxID=85995 RepID=UPI00374346AA